MREHSYHATLADLAIARRITAADVLLLRREVFRDGIVSREEATALLSLDEAVAAKCPEWWAFLVEAVADFLVGQEQPAGYVSEDKAAWLIAAISADGVVNTTTELEVLVSVLEKARSSPASLSAFALAQVALAVVDGSGPLAKGGSLTPGVICKPEVALLRRILYAYGGDGNIAITRAEASVLFDLNDRTEGAANDPEWSELFVKAVANFVLCSSGYEPPTRAEALRHEAFLDAAEPDIGGFFTRMAAGSLRGMLDAYAPSGSIEADWEARNREADAAQRRAEKVDAGEARWLVDRIGTERSMNENERALLAFIRQASPAVHPDLKPLLDRVA